ncbi:TVP38/TMEM64 family protein [Chelativorans sp. YIM 93263]|uniref:TVP38/TMEM64 family protein n=1 Tax=Chelativorans sp. YIM 93263 TaxID=2906648 RepID=UPI002377E699|nr:TVP38/TMEM64 family protein [Chelativorans sp. YIM 93263]
MSETETSLENNSKKRSVWRFLPLLFVVLVLGFVYAMGWHTHLTLSRLAESRAVLGAYVAAYPLLAPTLFALLYIAAVAASLPVASLLTIAGGFLFGWVLGGALVIVSATIGATLLFLAARTACGDFVRRRLGKRATRVAEGFEKDAFGYLLILRLAPVFPFWLVNVMPAAFNVPIRTYVGATALGIAPGTFAFAYLGHGLETSLVSAAESGQDLMLGDLVTPQLTLAFAALAVVVAIPVIVKKLSAAKLP